MMKHTDSKKISITLPAEIDRELKLIAKKERRTMSGIVQEASRYYLNIRQYEDLQTELSQKARALGIITEEDLEKVIQDHRKQRPED